MFICISKDLFNNWITQKTRIGSEDARLLRSTIGDLIFEKINWDAIRIKVKKREELKLDWVYIPNSSGGSEPLESFSIVDKQEVMESGDPSGQIRFEMEAIGNFIENKGWNFRFFYIRDTFSPFWHSIYTETERVAIGTYLGKDQNKIQNLLGEIK